MNCLAFVRSILAGGVLLLTQSAGAMDSDCAAIAKDEVRLACYDDKEGSGDIQGTGSIKGTITWQYNNFVGTRGDTESNVFLFKLPLAETFSNIKSYQAKMIGLGVAPTEKPGFFYAIKADGFGHYERNDIEAGEYVALIQSENTTPSPDDLYTKRCSEQFREYIEDLRFFNKVYCRPIFIEPGKSISLSHDFGNTYR
ncbi:MAG: hypothetical protein VX454_10895 [Pseudomonadota bacterium]|nr:hypothetical protein [Pseudomonadota bacterium]